MTLYRISKLPSYKSTQVIGETELLTNYLDPSLASCSTTYTTSVSSTGNALRLKLIFINVED